jgi:hypothetical protein
MRDDFMEIKPIEMTKKETMDGLRIKWQCSKLKKKSTEKKNNIHVVSFLNKKLTVFT